MRKKPYLLMARFIAYSGAFYSVGTRCIAPDFLALTRNMLACLVKGDSHVGKTAEHLDCSRSTQKNSLHPGDVAGFPHPRSYHCAFNARRTAKPAAALLAERQSKPDAVARSAGCLFRRVPATVFGSGVRSLSLHHGDYCDAIVAAYYSSAGQYDARGRGRA